MINSSLDSHTCPCHAAKYSQAASERETRVGFLGLFGIFFLAVAFRFLEALGSRCLSDKGAPAQIGLT